jgi:hypothetical protein
MSIYLFIHFIPFDRNHFLLPFLDSSKFKKKKKIEFVFLVPLRDEEEEEESDGNQQ